MAEEENQIHPLAPARIYGRSDEELSPVKPRRQQTSNKCLVYILTIIVVLCIATLVFSLTVFHIKSPKINLTSATIQYLYYLTAPSASLNATIVVDLTLKNKNFGRFEFKRFNATVSYENVVVGGAKVGGGSVGARGTKRWSLTVRVRSVGSVMESRDFKSDLNSGLVKIRSHAKLSGWVRVMKIVSKFRSLEMNCNMSLNLTTKAIQDLQCM